LSGALLIRDARIVNDGRIVEGDVLVRGDRIEAVGGDLGARPADEVIDARGPERAQWHNMCQRRPPNCPESDTPGFWHAICSRVIVGQVNRLEVAMWHGISTRAFIAGALAAAAMTSAGTTVSADTGMCWHLLTLAQGGQDVKIQFDFSTQGCGDPPFSLTLVRENQDGIQVTVFDDIELTDDDAYDVSEPECYSTVDCDEFPELCVDCDSNGVPECETCVHEYYFELTDECVPPGTWSYPESNQAWSSVPIDVADTGDSCLDGPDAGTDADTDTDADVVSGSGSSSCSIASTGADHNPGGLVALLLLCVGGLALAVSRNRA
jgi:hypothetical protein